MVVDKLRKVSLILMGLVMVIGGSLPTPALYQMGLLYEAREQWMIPLIITLPSIALLAGLMISALLSSKFDKKILVLLGLGLFLLGGLMPAWVDSLPLILFFRAMLGVGMGMVMPLQTSFFAQYPDDERAMLLGSNVAVNCVIGVAFFALAGYLVNFHWHYLFYLYGIMAPIILLVALFVPKETAQPEGEVATSAPTPARSKLPLKVYAYSAFTVAITVFAFLAPILSTYVAANGLGGSNEVGMMIAVSTACGAIGGSLVSLLNRYLKELAPTTMLVLVAVGLFLLTQTASLWFLVIGFGLIGFAQSVFNCLIPLKITQIVPISDVARATSVFLGLMFAAQFVAPYGILLLKPLVGSDQGVFYTYALVTLLLGGVFYGMNRAWQSRVRG